MTPLVVDAAATAALLTLLLLAVGGCESADADDHHGDVGCHGRLAQYRVVLKTFWSQQRFPKHYPEWAPSAEWSKMIGMLEEYVRALEAKRYCQIVIASSSWL